MNQEISFLNHVFDKQPNHFQFMELEDLFSLFSENNDFHFKRKLVDLGYFKRLYVLQKRAEQDIQRRNWGGLANYPTSLSFFLNGFHRDFIMNHQVNNNQTLKKSDFIAKASIPDGFIEKLQLSRYQLLKSLYPVFSLAQFTPGEGKKEAYVTNLAPYMALDIDIPYDDEVEMLNKLAKYVDVYCCLTSPSGGLRPIIKTDTSTEMMLKLIKWQHKSISIRNINRYLPSLYRTYQHVVFDKTQKALKKETLLVNGLPTPFVLDNKCKNINRFWYISRDKGMQININEGAQPIEINREDCTEFSKKLFPAVDCIFGAIG